MYKIVHSRFFRVEKAHVLESNGTFTSLKVFLHAGQLEEHCEPY